MTDFMFISIIGLYNTQLLSFIFKVLISIDAEVLELVT